MKTATVMFLLSFAVVSGFAQDVRVPAYFTIDSTLSDSLSGIVKSVGLDSTFNVGADGSEKISLAVVDLAGGRAVLGGVNYGNFLYPASVYKMYVAMEV
ncbi:MAG TPA: hypothetical protein PL001_02140, partial [Candidatus Kryptobacter bacterium]